jgi:DNA-binding NarL/FixJ family response regulator
MPGVDGIEAARLIRRDNPGARIVFVTVHAEKALVDRCLRTGALGYVLKDAAGDDLLSAMDAALRGERYISGDLQWRPGEK